MIGCTLNILSCVKTAYHHFFMSFLRGKMNLKIVLIMIPQSLCKWWDSISPHLFVGTSCVDILIYARSAFWHLEKEACSMIPISNLEIRGLCWSLLFNVCVLPMTKKGGQMIISDANVVHQAVLHSSKQVPPQDPHLCKCWALLYKHEN